MSGACAAQQSTGARRPLAPPDTPAPAGESTDTWARPGSPAPVAPAAPGRTDRLPSRPSASPWPTAGAGPPRPRPQTRPPKPRRQPRSSQPQPQPQPRSSPAQRRPRPPPCTCPIADGRPSWRPSSAACVRRGTGPCTRTPRGPTPPRPGPTLQTRPTARPTARPPPVRERIGSRPIGCRSCSPVRHTDRVRAQLL